MKHIVLTFAFVIIFVVLAPTPGQAQQQPLSVTGQPDSWEIRLEVFAITGFGEAQFGQSRDEVEDILQREFPGIDIEETFDPVQQTQIFTLVVPDLPPLEGVDSPGIATLNYVFGYHSQALMAINLDWHVPGEATPEQRSAVLAAGTAYVAELISYQWAPFQTVRGQVIGPNTVVLFAGRDLSGAGVEVSVEGVSLDVMLPDGTNEHWPATSGPAHLYIGLAANPDEPDIYRLPVGSF